MSLRRSKILRAKRKKAFVRLKTIADTSSVAKEFAHIGFLVQRLEEAKVLLADGSKANSKQKKIVLEETVQDAREMFWRANVAVATLEEMRKKVQRFLKDRTR